MAQLPPLPAHYSYSAEHEWVNATADAVVGATLRVGITAIASDALGEVVYADIPEVGATVTAGEICGEVESTKTVSDLFSPVTGEVTAGCRRWCPRTRSSSTRTRTATAGCSRSP